jgi:hypothetical protein
MMTERLVTNKNSDREVARQLAGKITELFDNGVNQLTLIKVCINPKHQKANIYASYTDKSRDMANGSEDSTANSHDQLITWPYSEFLENIEEAWEDYRFPKLQMERALLLS